MTYLLKRKIPAIFLHIQKTAGSSIVNIAAKHYGNKNISSHGDFVGRTPEEFRNIDFISGHFGFDFAKEFLKDRFSFTFLRDPAERVISFYFFCKDRDPNELPIYEIANNYDLERFIELAFDNEMVRARIWNSQVWRIAHGPGPSNLNINNFDENDLLKMAINNISYFDHVGTTENFYEDYLILSEKLNFPAISPDYKENVTRNKPVIDNLPKHLIRKIKDINKLDSVLYDFVINGQHW